MENDFADLDKLSDNEINDMFQDIIEMPELLAVEVKGSTPSNNLYCDKNGYCHR